VKRNSRNEAKKQWARRKGKWGDTIVMGEGGEGREKKKEEAKNYMTLSGHWGKLKQ